MVFKRPSGISITKMCIYIDKTAYKGNLTEEEQNTIYQYIYFIIFSLASKKKFFNSPDKYDEFALDLACDIYMRLVDPRQFEYKENGEPKLKRIKSILNYIKCALFGRKVVWMERNFKEIIDTEYVKDFNSDKLHEQLVEQVQASGKATLKRDFISVINDIPSLVREEINLTPYKNDKVMCKNLYLSVMLSLLKCFTLSKRNEKILNRKRQNLNYSPMTIQSFYTKETSNCITLWHLDNSLYNYVGVLINKTKNRIKNELYRVNLDNKVPTQLVKHILLSAIDFDGDKYE